MIYKKLLVPVDFGDCTETALAFTRTLAEPGAEIALIHVIDEQVLEPFEGLLDLQEYSARVDERLKVLAKGFEEAGFDVKRVVVDGTPREELFTYADGWKPQIIVVGSHGRTGLRRLLLGSVAEKILRHADVPVCIVKKIEDGPATQLRNIAFGTDFEKSCSKARTQFVTAIERSGAKGHVLHAFDGGFHYSFTLVPDLVDSSSAVQESVQASRDQARTQLDREVASLRKQKLDVDGTMLEGPAWEELSHYATEKDCDLLILGTHRYQGIDRMLLGSVAEKTVRLCEQPVLVVPNPAD